jgi:hypothetical protein
MSSSIMILIFMLFVLLLCYSKDNYQNYLDYNDIGETHMCPEEYEKTIGEIVKLREKRPDILLSDLGYDGKMNDFETRVNNIYTEPLPSPANFEELFYQ